MTKNGNFVAILALLLFVTSFVTAIAGSDPQNWLGMWFILVSVVTLIGATAATYAAACDYLMENEE